MKRKQLVSGVPIAGVALSLMATPAVGQESPLLDFQLHVGRGDGYVSSVTYGADLAWNISDWAAIQGSIGRWHSFFVDCLDIWPDSYACAFEGNSMVVGLRTRVLEGRGFGIYGGVGVGLFRHTDNVIRKTNTAIAAQIGLPVNLSRAWRLVGSWRRMWIFDHESEELLGQRPRYSVVTVGLERRLIF